MRPDDDPATCSAPPARPGLPGPTGPIGDAGAVGAAGRLGASGADGRRCWDLDGDGVGDRDEDNNGDTDVDILDCAANPRINLFSDPFPCGAPGVGKQLREDFGSKLAVDDDE